MRTGIALAFVLGMTVSVPLAGAAENKCERLVDSKECICAIPKEWVPGQVGDLSDIVGNVLVTGAAGYTPASDGKIPLYSGDNVVVPAQASALLKFGEYCQKYLPQNASVIIKQVDECACAALTEVKPGVPWWPAAVIGGGGAIVVITTIPGNEPESN
jgi:hypothetical protein